MNLRADRLYEELERSPEDWSVRLRLMEMAVESGNIEEARRLVRSSPGENALPAELQERVYEILTREPPNEFSHLPKADS